MGFYFSKRFFGGLIIRKQRITYKTLALFPCLSSIIYADVIEPIEFFFYGEENESMAKDV